MKTIVLIALTSLFTLVGVVAQSVQKTFPKPLGRLVDIGKYRLHLNCSGKGRQTVVLIAGSGDFSFDWGLVQPEIARFTRVCSYDRAGLAWSDLGPTPRTMRQDAHELRLLLEKAGERSPLILVGHSIGGLIARVFADDFPDRVVGMVLVDSTTEDTKLSYQGKIVRVRDGATGRGIPPIQTMLSSPPKPPTNDDIKQAEFNKQLFGTPKIYSPFNKLSQESQTLRLWALNNPKLSAKTEDYWAEELQVMHIVRSKDPVPLGDKPLAVLIGKNVGETPKGISQDEWRRLFEEKLQQKIDLAKLSRNGYVVFAEKSGHHIQLEQPDIVIEAIRKVTNNSKRQNR